VAAQQNQITLGVVPCPTEVLILEQRGRESHCFIERDAALRTGSGGHDGDVERLPALTGERQAERLSAHRLRVIAIDLKTDGAGVPQLLHHLPQPLRLLYDLVVVGRRLHRRGEFPLESAELQLPEQSARHLRIGGMQPERLRIEFDRHVEPQGGQPEAETGAIGVLQQALPVTFALDLGCPAQHTLEGSEAADQLLRPLLSDSRNAWNVVGAVTPQRQNVRHLPRFRPEPLFHTVAVEQALRHRVEDANPLADQLQEILVACHDDHLEAGAARLVSQRPDQIVGLESLHLDDGSVQHRADSLHPGDLGDQLLRRFRPVGLVLLIHFVAEGRPGEVERDRQIGGLERLDQLTQHAGEAEHGIGGEAVAVAELPYGVERPEEIGGPIDQVEGPVTRVCAAHRKPAAARAILRASARRPSRNRPRSGARSSRRHLRRRSAPSGIVVCSLRRNAPIILR
jgi:hypothetical protein